jgi:hypothetical protein
MWLSEPRHAKRQLGARLPDPRVCARSAVCTGRARRDENFCLSEQRFLYNLFDHGVTIGPKRRATSTSQHAACASSFVLHIMRYQYRARTGDHKHILIAAGISAGRL